MAQEEGNTISFQDVTLYQMTPYLRREGGVSAGLTGDKLSDKSGELSDRELLQAIAEPVSSTQRTSREHVKAAIIELCCVAELSAQEIAGLLSRKEQTVRQYIEELCRDGELNAKFPLKTHPKQKYRASSK